MRFTAVLCWILIPTITSAENPDERTINVTGTGIAVVPANGARVTFGVRTTGQDYKLTKEENEKACKALLEGIDELKLVDIKILPLALDAGQADATNARALRGALGGGGALPVPNPIGREITHTVTQLYTATYRNPKSDVLAKDAERIFSTVIERGSNAASLNTSGRYNYSPFGTGNDRSASLSFFRDNEAVAQKEALKKAVADAVAKAEAIAEAVDANAKVKVLSVTDGPVPATRNVDPDFGPVLSLSERVNTESADIAVTVRVQVRCRY